MSDLHNPLFDEEKEFLERKKLEYERALRGDVDHIKDQSVAVGKVALVGAGLAGGIWLLTKAFGGKKRKRYARKANQAQDDNGGHRDEVDADGFDGDNGFGAEYYTAGNGKRYKSVGYHKSAASSAQAFMEHDSQGPGREADDLGLGSKAAPHPAEVMGAPIHAHQPSPYDTEEFEDDPFQDLPYDDSRRLSASHAFDDEDEPDPRPASSRSNKIASVLQAFLKTDTGKVLVAQVAAVALAMVTKKVNEFFPADKNADLAASPGYAPTATGSAPAVSLASPASPDASTHTSAV